MVASYVYEGFGKVIGQNGGGGGPYQFCGLWGYRNEHDAGLLHVGARYYEFETGRWVQKDPDTSDILDPRTLSLYVYVASNPINRIDPSGESWLTLAGIIGGGVVSLVGAGLGFVIGGPIGAGIGGAIGGALGGFFSGYVVSADQGGTEEQAVRIGVISAGIGAITRGWGSYKTACKLTCWLKKIIKEAFEEAIEEIFKRPL